VQRNTNTVKRCFNCDHFTFGMAFIQQCTGLFIPDSLSDLINQIFINLCGYNPLGTNGEGLSLTNAFIGICGDNVLSKKTVFFYKCIASGPLIGISSPPTLDVSSTTDPVGYPATIKNASS
jgi:hypothetical protein